MKSLSLSQFNPRITAGPRRVLATRHSPPGAEFSVLSPQSSVLSTPRRGQSMVEFALLLPLLLALLAVIIEAGLALNAWIRVNTAARDATRFAMDSGRPNDTASLALDKLMGVDFGTSREISGSTNLDVYIVTGSTGAAGTITSWSVDHRYDGNSDSSSPVVTQAKIQGRLNSQGLAVSRNISIVIVEVDFKYTPLLSTLVTRGNKIPMTSYAMVQRCTPGGC